jgi:hypothetical protein
MRVYSFDNKNYASINGKDYFLLRGYKTNYDKFIFIQVTGTTPLNKEDLPGSDFNVLKTLLGKQRIWTAYAKRFFNYDQEGSNDFKLAFIGLSTQGSYYLALKWLTQKFKHPISNQELANIARAYVADKKNTYHFKTLTDHGNSKVDLVLFESGYSLDDQDIQLILKGGEDHDRTED